MDSATSVTNSLKNAKLFETFKHFEKAVNLYRELMEQHPCDFRAFFNCARILAFEEITLCEALQLFDKVIELNKNVIEAYSAAAAILIKLNRPAEAEVYCNRGLQLDCSDRNCTYNLNVALRQLGRIEEAISLCWEKLAATVTLPYPVHSQLADPVSHDTSEKITIVCVKWGTKYGPEYVNNLYNAAMRCEARSAAFSTHKFVCFTDDCTDLNENIICSPFQGTTTSWKGWWLKAQLFSPVDLLSGWVLYIDLDTILCGNLDFMHNLTMPVDTMIRKDIKGASFIDPRQTIYVLAAETFKNEARRVGMNSSLLLWHTSNSTLHMLYTYLERHYAALCHVIYKFDHYLEMMLYKHVRRPELADSHFRSSNASICSPDYVSIASFTTHRRDSSVEASSGGEPASVTAVDAAATVRCCYFQDYCAGKIIDYFEYVDQKRHVSVTSRGRLPNSDDSISYSDTSVKANVPVHIHTSPAIICFPLKPKPHQLLDESFVREHWLGEETVPISEETVD